MENEINSLINPSPHAPYLPQSPSPSPPDLFNDSSLENIDFTLDQLPNPKVAVDLQKMNKKMENVMKEVRKDLFHKLNEMSKDIKIISEFSSVNGTSLINGKIFSEHPFASFFFFGYFG